MFKSNVTVVFDVIMSVVKSNETMGQNNQHGMIDVFIAFKFIFGPTQFNILNKLLTIVIIFN